MLSSRKNTKLRFIRKDLMVSLLFLNDFFDEVPVPETDLAPPPGLA
jgi:hypothetical protein